MKEEYWKHDPETGELLNHKGRRTDDLGREIPDPRPLAPPIGYLEQPPLHELIRQMIRSEDLRKAAEAEGAGSFEEEDDFEVGEDYDPTSPYENEFDPEPPPETGEGQSPSETPSTEAEPTPENPSPG